MTAPSGFANVHGQDDLQPRSMELDYEQLGGLLMIDRLLFLLTLFSALGCGLIAGVFFAFSAFVMKALARIQPGAGNCGDASHQCGPAYEQPPLLWSRRSLLPGVVRIESRETGPASNWAATAGSGCQGDAGLARRNQTAVPAA